MNTSASREIQVLYTAYDALTYGDLDELRAILEPDVLVHDYRALTMHTTYAGLSVVLDRLKSLLYPAWLDLSFELHKSVQQGPYGIVHGTARIVSRYTGVALDVQHMVVARLSKSGCIAEVWIDCDIPGSPILPSDRTR